MNRRNRSRSMLLTAVSITLLTTLALTLPGVAAAEPKRPVPAAASMKAATTALLKAAEAGDAKVIPLLLRRATDPNAGDSDGWTPLLFATAGGHIEAARALLQGGGDAKRTADDGTSALHLAAARGDVALARVLLGAGADPWAQDARGRSAIAVAQLAGHAAVYEVLVHESSAAGRPAAMPAGPYGPIMGVLQLGMSEEQLRQVLGQRFAQAEISSPNVLRIRRHAVFGGYGELTLTFDAQRRLSGIAYATTVADRLEANAVLLGVEGWAGMPRAIDTQRSNDRIARHDDTHTLTLQYDARATNARIDIQLSAAAAPQR